LQQRKAGVKGKLAKFLFFEHEQAGKASTNSKNLLEKSKCQFTSPRRCHHRCQNGGSKIFFVTLSTSHDYWVPWGSWKMRLSITGSTISDFKSVTLTFKKIGSIVKIC
jgi:hypothetical protein